MKKRECIHSSDGHRWPFKEPSLTKMTQVDIQKRLIFGRTVTALSDKYMLNSVLHFSLYEKIMQTMKLLHRVLIEKVPLQAFSFKNKFLSSLDFSFQILKKCAIRKFYIRCYNRSIVSPAHLYKGHNTKCTAVNNSL